MVLGWLDERWGEIFDRVKAWAGEETGDEVAEAMLGWRESFALLKSSQDAQVFKLLDLEGKIKHLDERVDYLEDDAGPRLSEADGPAE